jgi:hypothetical protein
MSKETAMPEYKITVTQEDIDTGWPCMPSHCPIAIAVCRATDSEWASVGDIAIEVPGVRFYTPREAQVFIRQFDDHQDVKPITFTISNCSEGYE